MMSEPIKPAVGDLEALRAALDRVANEIINTLPTSDLGPDLALQDIVRAAYNGPRTLATARALLASPRARRGLTRYWAEECPPPEVIDATVASPTATEEETALAQATYDLVTTLHANTCANCRERLDALTREMRHLEDPDLVIRRWTLTARPEHPHGTVQGHTPQLVGVRGETPHAVSDDTTSAAAHTYTVTDPTLYADLTARPIAQPQDITVRIGHDVTSHLTTVTLLVPGGMSRDVKSVTVVLRSTTGGQVRIPIDLAPRDDDDVEFTGTTTLPPEAGPVLDTVDLEVG